MIPPKWAQPYVDSDFDELLTNAVARAESMSKVEIVPVVVRQSSFTGLIAAHLHAVFLVFLLLTWILVDIPKTNLTLALLALLALIGFALCQYLGSTDLFARWILGKDNMHTQVFNRAKIEFFEHGLYKTKEKTGVLVFVSVLEHMAVIMVDEAIAKEFPNSVWQEEIDLLVSGIKQQHFCQAMCNCILDIGEKLKESFPISATDSNELPNKPIITD